MSRQHAQNILLTTSQDQGLGGVQVVVRDLADHLEANGRSVHFLHGAPLRRLRGFEARNFAGRVGTYRVMPSMVRDNGLLSLAAFLVYLPITMLQLTGLMRRHRIDVANCHYLDAYFIHVAIAARLSRIPLVVSVHGADVDSYATAGWVQRLAYRLIVRSAACVVACSDALAARTVSAFPFARSKTTYVHNGLRDAHQPEGRTGRTLPQPYVLAVCRHVHKKGIDTLLRAFAIVSRQRPDLSLVLVGDGPLFREHVDAANALGIGARVVFAGGVAHDEVSAFFAGCMMFVLPSRDEPFGIVVLEAASHAKAVVCTNVGGVPEIVTDGQDAVMFEPDDHARMAAAIVALADDPVRRESLGRALHQTLLTRFLWSDRVLDYIAVFEGRTPARQSHPCIVDTGSLVPAGKGLVPHRD